MTSSMLRSIRGSCRKVEGRTLLPRSADIIIVMRRMNAGADKKEEVSVLWPPHTPHTLESQQKLVVAHTRTMHAARLMIYPQIN